MDDEPQGPGYFWLQFIAGFALMVGVLVFVLLIELLGVLVGWIGWVICFLAIWSIVFVALRHGWRGAIAGALVATFIAYFAMQLFFKQ